MELRDIEYFAVVAEHGNVRRASEALGLSPPALSKSLRRLERSIQARLVERSAKGVTLTTVGAALLERVAHLRLALEDVAREAADLSRGQAGRLRIGANPVDCESLPAAYADLLGSAPRLTIEVDVADIDVSLPLLRKGELDFIVVVAPEQRPSGLAQEPLYDDEYVVTCSRTHRLAGRKRVTLADLSGERWTLTDASVRPQQLLRKILAAHGEPPPRVAVASRSQRLKILTAASTNLLGFSSRKVIRGAAESYPLVELPVRELTIARPVCVLYRKDGYLSPVARRIIENLKLQNRKARARAPRLP